MENCNITLQYIYIYIYSPLNSVSIYFRLLHSFILGRLIFGSHRLVPPFIPRDDWNSISGLFPSTEAATCSRSYGIPILQGFVLSARRTGRKSKRPTPSVRSRIQAGAFCCRRVVAFHKQGDMQKMHSLLVKQGHV
jgi:hypothetical protein